MEEFNITADVVTRNNIRKGAIKIDLCDWHPDIIDFIHCKDDTSKLQFMNISVSLSDDFMIAVLDDADWKLEFPYIGWDKEIYDKEWDGNLKEWKSKGYPVDVYKTIKAKDLYKMIMEAAWKTGEPGVSFRDAMDKDNPNPHLGTVDSTNPCSEFASIPYNSCNLGSINLLNMVEDGKLDRDKLIKTVRRAVTFLDNMITVNELPIDKITETTKGVRSVGLGVMGFADMLYELQIAYDSSAAIKFTDDLFALIYREAEETSRLLAIEKGAYPLWKGSTWDKQGIKVRNSNFLSIAPTGSISFLAGVSGGIEPNFGLVFTRRTNEGDIYYITNPVFEEHLKVAGLYSEELLQKVADNNGSCQGVDEVPGKFQEVFVTTMDMGPTDHIDMLSIIQKHVDLSISKTVNVKNDATVEDVMDVYMDAWRKNSKGITVYRDGSRQDQTLSIISREEPEEVEEATGLNRGDWAPIASDTQYYKRKIYIGCGKITLFVGYSPSEQKLQEFWVKRSGTGGCEKNLENMTIAMSGMMRLGGSIFNIDKAFEGVGGCNSFVFKRARGDNVSKGNNCGNAVLFEIKKFLSEMEEGRLMQEILPIFQEASKPMEMTFRPLKMEEIKGKCPECGEPIDHEGGCTICRACGYSHCN